MSESMYKEENNNISYIKHVKKNNLKNSLTDVSSKLQDDQRNHQPHQLLIPQWCSPDSMDDFMSG